MMNNRTWSQVAALALALGLCACGGEGTTGKMIALHTRVATDLPADHTVTTSMGWVVTLTKAVVGTGAMYYYDGEPAFTQAPRRSRRQRLWQALSPIATAWAHPGHYIEGSPKGQMLEDFSVDLMAGPAMLPDGAGISGLIRSATFSFAAHPAGPPVAVTTLGGHVVATQGSASKDGRTVNFILTADLADVSRTAKDGKITGCAFKEITADADGTVTITIKPRVWFSLVDFADVAPGTPEAPTVIGTDTTAHIGFALGLGQLSAYQFEYTTTAL
jgi:hypothetical protein